MRGDTQAGEIRKSLQQAREEDGAKSQILELLGRITAQHSVDDICRTTVESVRELMGFERAGLFLWDDRAKTFRGTFGTSMQLKTTDEHIYLIEILPDSPEEHILNGSVIERGCKLGAPEAMPGEEGVKADLVGLRAGGRLFGILSVDNRLSRRPVTDIQLKHLLLMGEVLGNALEISKARLALANSEQRFRQVTETSGDWIWEVDCDGRYVYVSPVAKAILGYEPQELMNQPWTAWVVEGDRKRVEAELRRVLKSKATIRRLINQQKHKDGLHVVLETTAMPIVDEAGHVTGCRGAHRDVTHEYDLEAQLRHSQKMDAIGRLAGGIAHDFNNLLTAILGCSSLMLEDLPEDHPMRADLGRIQAAGERAASLTRQLLAFSRRQVLHVQKLSLNETVQDMEKLLQRTLGENIELITRLDPALQPVETDADQLQQVLMHLAINGRDAMIDPYSVASNERVRSQIEEHRDQMRFRAKQLVIETANAKLDAAFCRTHPGIQPGPYVRLSVSDTGIGMPPEVREHLFEPFFTTKEVGKGSGLGLSTIYGIVKQMGGVITVDSELGEGTTFTLYLPLTAAKPETGPAEKVDRRQMEGHETILVVEDEEVVRNLTVRMLQTLGYRTLEAGNGVEALEACRHLDEPIHLILSDMVMPHMSGKAFVEELRKVREDFKVLFVSGYSSEDSVSGEVIGNDTPLIQKPFTREVLGRRVREILDKG